MWRNWWNSTKKQFADKLCQKEIRGPEVRRGCIIRVWCCTPVIPALIKLRKKDHEYNASLDHRARPYLKTNKNKNNKEKQRPYQSSMSHSLLELFIILWISQLVTIAILTTHKQMKTQRICSPFSLGKNVAKSLSGNSLKVTD
jgi:ATP-dependent Zn protease